jgi:hypothetical protein
MLTTIRVAGGETGKFPSERRKRNTEIASFVSRVDRKG